MRDGWSPRTRMNSMEPSERHLCQAIGKVLNPDGDEVVTQLRELKLTDFDFQKSDLLLLIDALKKTNTTTLQKLTLRNVGLNDQTMQQLSIAMSHNKSLSVLDVKDNPDITVEGIRAFCDNPKHSLERLSFGIAFDQEREYWIPIAKQMASGMKDNVTVSEISYMFWLNRTERFYLDLNRLGRRYLYQDDTAMVKVWPHILARVAKKRRSHLLFFFLRERVDLISSYNSIEPSRKRARIV